MDAPRMRSTRTRENNGKAASATEDAKRTQTHKPPVIAMDISGQKAKKRTSAK